MAPQVDDYYLNVLDWSQGNVLAVGLGSCLYLWNSATCEIDLLLDNGTPENIVTSLKWNGVNLLISFRFSFLSELLYCAVFRMDHRSQLGVQTAQSKSGMQALKYTAVLFCCFREKISNVPSHSCRK